MRRSDGEGKDGKAGEIGGVGKLRFGWVLVKSITPLHTQKAGLDWTQICIIGFLHNDLTDKIDIQVFGSGPGHGRTEKYRVRRDDAIDSGERTIDERVNCKTSGGINCPSIEI